MSLGQEMAHDQNLPPRQNVDEPSNARVAPTAPSTRTISVEELLAAPASEVPLAGAPGPMPQSSYEEVRIMYLHEYGKGMDLFFETQWYTYKGWDHLVQDVKTFEMFRAMLDAFLKTKANDYEKFLKLPQLEARVTWALLCMPRVVHERAVSNGSVAFDPELDQLLQRLTLYEHIVTNKRSHENLITPPSQYPSTDANVPEELVFWHHLGYMASLDPLKDSEACTHLPILRRLTAELENRDVLYSMAVVRSLRMPVSGLESPPDQFLVARKFIEDEASSKGTNQVIQRLCGIAVRSWIALR